MSENFKQMLINVLIETIVIVLDYNVTVKPQNFNIKMFYFVSTLLVNCGRISKHSCYFIKISPI